MKHHLILSLTMLLGGLLLAQDAPKTEPPPEPAPDKPPAAEPAPDKPAAPKGPKVVEATDAEAIKAALGKYITIKGKVRESNRSPKTAAMRIWFEGTADFAVIIEADEYDAIDGWGLTEAVGKEMFSRGKVMEDTGLLYIRIKKPELFVASADKLPKPPAKKPGEPEEEKVFEPLSPGAVLPVSPGATDLKPKLDTASVKAVLMTYEGGSANFTLSEVSSEIMDEDESGPMQATFETKPKADPKPMVTAMTYLPKRHKSAGWPRDKAAHFLVDDVLADSAPPNLAAAVLIECMLTGVEIPENVVLFGGIDGSGAISREADRARSDASFVDAIRLAAAAAAPPVSDEDEKKPRSAFAPSGPQIEKSIWLITGEIPAGTLDDFILDEDWNTLNSTLVISCKNLDEAMAVIRGAAAGDELGKTITDLDAAQKVLRERSIRMLSNDAVWARVVAAGKAFKGNATAYAYARIRTKKVAETYSLDRCIGHIHAQIEKAGEVSKFNDRDLRKYMRDRSTEMGSIERQIHPDAVGLLEAAEDYLDEMEDYKSEAEKAKKKDEKPSERVVESYRAAKKVYDDARALAKKKVREKPAAGG